MLIVEIHTLEDVERVNVFLTKKVLAKQPVRLSVENHASPSDAQIAAINGLVRSLFREHITAVSSFDEILSPADFRELILDLFMGDYLEVLPDGTITTNKASFKYGTNKHELSQTIDYIIHYFASNHGLNVEVKGSKGAVKEISSHLNKANGQGREAHLVAQQ